MWQRRTKTYRTSPLRASLLADLNTTQAKVVGFDLAAIQAAHVVLIGAGGIGSHVAVALARKGVGRMTLIDDDVVELKNLTRQHFGRRDVGKYKAHRLARSIADTGLFPTELTAHPFRFQELCERGETFEDATVLICGVDNNPTRKAVCDYALRHRIPAIYAALSRTGNEAYTMVQEPAGACWACAFPHYVNDQTYPCNLPGIADVLMLVAGQIVFTVDTIVGGRPREWNVRETFLDGSIPDRARKVERRADCAVCGNLT
jgi:molybdopterin/thiamine biosynthesis adenylyltransferase